MIGRIDHNILLRGTSPLQVQAAGDQAAQRNFDLQQDRAKAERQEQLRELFRTQGAGILTNDPAALQKLAALDPGLAQQSMAQAAQLDMQDKRLDLAQQGQQFNQGIASQRMDLSRQGFEANQAHRQQQMALAEQDRMLKLRKMKIDEEREQAERVLASLSTADTPEEWDAMAARLDEQLVGQFESRDALIAEVIGLHKALQTATPSKPPAGYQFAQDGSLAFVPGGPADPATIRQATEARKTDNVRRVRDPATGNIVFEEGSAEALKAEKRDAAERRMQQENVIVLDDIDRSLDLIENSAIPVTGLPGMVLSGTPGTAAHNLSNLLNTIKASASFSRLQAMRDSSPTGGALGNVTERELILLQAAIGSMEQSQSEGQLVQNLSRVREIYAEIIHGKKGAQTPQAEGAKGFESLSKDERKKLYKQVIEDHREEINKLPLGEQGDFLRRKALEVFNGGS